MGNIDVVAVKDGGEGEIFDQAWAQSILFESTVRCSSNLL